MERITERQLAGLVHRTNLLLPDTRAVWLQGQNGGFTVYLRDTKPVKVAGNCTPTKSFDGTSMRKSLTHGTKRECWEYLQAFVEAIYTVQEA